MRKFFFFAAVAAIAIGCNTKPDETSTAETKTGGDSKAATFALPVSYSSSFEMGSSDKAAMIVQGSWKDWQDNSIDNMKNWLADSAVLHMSNNQKIVGIDSIIADWKRGRAKYSKVIDTIDAVIPVYSKDKKEDWVLIWATEINTDLSGKVDTAAIMETWRINKDGKADLLLQFDRHTRKN